MFAIACAVLVLNISIAVILIWSTHSDRNRTINFPSQSIFANDMTKAMILNHIEISLLKYWTFDTRHNQINWAPKLGKIMVFKTKNLLTFRHFFFLCEDIFSNTSIQLLHSHFLLRKFSGLTAGIKPWVNLWTWKTQSYQVTSLLIVLIKGVFSDSNILFYWQESVDRPSEIPVTFHFAFTSWGMVMCITLSPQSNALKINCCWQQSMQTNNLIS